MTFLGKFFGFKSVGKHFLGLIVLSASSILVCGQTATPALPDSPAKSEAASGIPTKADENFVLNIQERRIVRENLEAATAVGTNHAARNLNLNVGVAITVARINVLLRNVQATVRFRGNVERIVEIINKRQEAQVAPPPK